MRAYSCCTLVFCCVLQFNTLNGQQFKNFSGKPETFISEVHAYASSVLDDAHEKILKEFITNWDSAHFDAAQKQQIIDVSKCLIDKKARPIPDYFNFISLLNLFLTKQHPKASVDAWFEATLSTCSKRKTSLSAINRSVQHALTLLQDGVVYDTQALTWKPLQSSYYYKFEGELKIYFNNCDLVCYAKHDSILILKTNGVLVPATLQWQGRGGFVTWERAGYAGDSIFAQLANYTIDLTKNSYIADSVLFTNKQYFDTPLLGQLEDNVTLVTRKSNATFPKFESYKKHFSIRNMYPNINYEGGFSMQGARLVGQGSKEEPAKLFFFRSDTLRLRSTSLYFIFRPEKILGINSAVVLYLDKDSIYHGDLQFEYNTRRKEISLLKSENYTAQSPFLDSYHQVDINFEQLLWRINEPVVLFTTTPGSSIGKALFESLNFFNNKEFEELQYYDDVHPLVLLRKYANYCECRNFSAFEFATFIKRPIDQVHTLLFPLALKGYIFYDPSTENIEIKQRMYDNLKAYAGQIDYDVVRFLSTTDAPLENAALDLRNNDIKIYGIPQIFLSDSQNVAIYPKDQTIILKRNRNFQFDGVVSAGLFTHFGRNFFFNYDEFKITLKDVDSVQLRVIDGYDNYGKPMFRDVHSVIQEVTGDLLIDKPDNKSGLKNNPEYPIFNSRGFSYVYYDDKSIINGVYDRRKEFYFKIDPYSLDSLDNFKKEGMEFLGTFLSANIIPALSEKLVLQEDYSLGFKHKTPNTGLPLYKDKGTFTNVIALSNKGLHGNGTLTYLNATAQSGDFTFFPDSMNTIAPDFTIAASASGTQYPPVSGKNVGIHWDPYKNNMAIKNIDQPFDIFNKETKLLGSLALTPAGLTGQGVIDLTSAVARSKKFVFAYNIVDADTTDFSLRSVHTTEYAVNTKNVKAHIDFGSRTGTFTSNEPIAITEFPENKYIALLDAFKWKMDKKELEMGSLRKQPASTAGLKYGFKDEPLVGSKYISVKKGQDSLSFISSSATYDYDKNLILASNVAYIEVADARIIPVDHKVVIDEGAQMKPFANAKIMANTATRFHNMYEANVTVNGRFDYLANGKYNYINENNTIQTVLFSEIKADSTHTTVASGDIVEPDNFTLSPDFKYQGKVMLRAPDKILSFDGYFQIQQSCSNYATSWIQFKAPINPVDIQIPIDDKPLEINRKPNVFGTLITLDSIHVYSSFFGLRKNHSDTLLATSSGMLKYDKNNFRYMVGSPEKLKKQSLPGNLVTLNNKICLHHDEGPVKLGVDLGQLKIVAAGNIDHDLKANTIKLKLSMSVDFFIHNKSIEHAALMIDSVGNNPPVDITQPFFKENFGNLADTASLNKFYAQLTKGEKLKELPEAFRKTIFIDEVNLVWDDVTNSYRSTGKIGIGYIAGRKIHKYFEGYMEVYRKRSGDLMDLYLQVDEKNYYYFGYTRGTMQLASGDQQFNTQIRELNDNQRSLKVERGQTPYTFLMATEHKMLLVRKRWKTGEAETAPDEQTEKTPTDSISKMPVDSTQNKQQ